MYLVVIKAVGKDTESFNFDNRDDLIDCVVDLIKSNINFEITIED